MPQPMRNIMAELYQVGTRTDLYPDAGGAAFASRKFRNETFANHEVRYHGEADKEEVDRIGNLTHELTHVSVQDKFDKDYVNYTNPPPGPVDAPTFNPNAERMQNEEDRQRQQSVSSADNAIQVKLENLQKLTLKDGCLNQEQRNQVREKLTYGIQSPHIEFDTVINQILTWLYHWGVTSDKSKLARELSNVAAQNQKERISQNRIVASTKKKPTFKPATQAIGEKPSSWKDKFRKS
ncbi:hypothetical protein [Nostoc sp. LPT]|nr:hypothetical protein [Nostoc sp. LPT]